MTTLEHILVLLNANAQYRITRTLQCDDDGGIKLDLELLLNMLPSTRLPFLNDHLRMKTWGCSTCLDQLKSSDEFIFP